MNGPAYPGTLEFGWRDDVTLLWFLIVGFLAGAAARALVPGDDPMPWWQTLLLGVVGSYVGGFLVALFPGGRSPLDFTTSGLIGSIIGAIIALLIYRNIRARG